jgi:glycine/D-amino acid oxidase-like deaminating enzyme
VVGLDAEWIDRDDLRRCYGIDRPGGIRSAGAAEVDPYALAHMLIADARRRGLRVFGRTSVLRVEAREEGATIRLADGHRVSSRHVVFATGYETREFVGVGDARLLSTFVVTSVADAVPSPWRESRALIWERADPYLYLRTTTDGRVIVGGEDEDFRDPEHRDALLPAKAERLARRFHELFPDAELPVEGAWAGTFGETADGLPYIGAHEEWPSCQFALGYGGNGIVFSVLAAQMICDAIGGRTHPLAPLFRFGR